VSAPRAARSRLDRIARTLRSPRALARLNHVLVPADKTGRDRARKSIFVRAFGPLVVLGSGLSREGRALFGMTMLVGLAGLDVGQSQVYLLFAMLAGLLLTSLVSRPFYRVDGIELRVDAPARVEAGEPMQLVVRLENTGSVPRLSLRMSSPFLPWDGRWVEQPEGVRRLAPGERASVVAKARFVARGEHHLDSFEVAALTPMGLATGPRRSSDGARFLVVPRRANVTSITLEHRRPRVRGSTHASIARGESEIAAVRPYRPGDPLKHLHPRTWARTGKPHVKQWVDERTDRVALVVLLDGDEAAESEKEAALALAAGVASRLVRSEHALATLVLDGTSFPIAPRTGPLALDIVLDRLATHPLVDDPVDAERVLGAALDALSSLVLVTADASPRRVALVESMTRSGLRPKWIVVDPPASRGASRSDPAANATPAVVAGSVGGASPVRVRADAIEAQEALAL
jgi:uncharacterized protein (DUF58 family)